MSEPDWVEDFDWIKSASTGEKAELKHNGILYEFGGPEKTTIFKNGEEIDEDISPILNDIEFTFHRNEREPTKVEVEGTRDGDKYRVVLERVHEPSNE